jgi:peroxiredoxin family protein
LTQAFDLCLPEPEQRRAAQLATQWTDLLYVPGPSFASSLDPEIYRSTFVIVPAQGRAVRVSSFVVPAFGGELCRIMLEPLASFRAENLGSFFEPDRRGVVYAMSSDRKTGAARPPDRPGWSYQGSSLRPQLDRLERVRIIRERVTGGSGDATFSWVADRGLALTGRDGREMLLLAGTDRSEQALFITGVSFYRALLDPTVPEIPGASVREMLGYGDREEDLRVEVLVEPAGARLTGVRLSPTLRSKRESGGVEREANMATLETEKSGGAGPLTKDQTTELAALVGAEVSRQVGALRAELDKTLAELRERTPEDRAALVVFSGDLDRVLAAFVIATGAAAAGLETSMFFTFWGLSVVKKKGAAVAGKGFKQRMFAMMTPEGSEGLGTSQLNFFGMGATMLRSMMKEQGIASLEELMGMAKDLGVKMTACTMSMDAMGIAKGELLDELEYGGVAAFMADASRARVSLFI